MEWENLGTRGSLVAATVEGEGKKTESSWIAFEDRRLVCDVWFRIASRGLAEECLSSRLAHRKGRFLDPVLDAVFVQAMPPGEEELRALYGPGQRDRDVVAVAEISEVLVRRCHAVFLEVLPRLRTLGEFVLEVQDGTLSIRYGVIFANAEPYRIIVHAMQKILSTLC